MTTAVDLVDGRAVASGRLPEGPVHVALVETAGNQAFIFATNRLRENVGASHLVASACDEWVREAMVDAPEPVHELSISSGRALVWSESPAALRAVIGTVTRRALVEAPGLTVSGALTAWDPDAAAAPDPSGRVTTGLGALIRSLAEVAEQRAGARPAGAARFLRLPPVAGCTASAFPAERSWRDPGGAGPQPVSESSYRKRHAGTAGMDRFLRAFPKLGRRPLDFDELERQIRASTDVAWFAIVHVDGNGVGQTFIDLGERALRATDTPGAANRMHFDALSALSGSLTDATNTALDAALDAALPAEPDPGERPLVVPIVVGGDDITVVCDARVALRFTEAFLTTFETETARAAAALRDVLGDHAPGVERFSAAAGIAIVKPHFPFHAAYALAEQLIEEAKSTTKSHSPGPIPPSSFDVHQLADASGWDLDRIREGRRSRDGDVELWGGPYVVGGELPGLRSVDWLRRGLDALAGGADGERALSRRAAGKVRAALFEGPEASAHALGELTRVLPGEALEPQSGREGTGGGVVLDDGARRSSGFVDLIDLVDLWGAPS